MKILPFSLGNFPAFDQTPMVDVRPGVTPENSQKREMQFTCNVPRPGLIPPGLMVEVRWYVKEAHRTLGPFRINATRLPHVLHEADWAPFRLALGINVSVPH